MRLTLMFKALSRGEVSHVLDICRLVQLVSQFVLFLLFLIDVIHDIRHRGIKSMSLCFSAKNCQLKKSQLSLCIL